MAKDIKGKVDPRSDLTGVGTPEVAAPTVNEMKAAGKEGAKGVERETPTTPGTDDRQRNTVELDCEGMTGYRQTDSVLGSEGNTN